MVQAWISGDRFLSPAMVCEMIPGMTLDILAARRKRRISPPFHKPTGQYGGVVVYLESDILQWVLDSRVDTRPH